MRQRFVWIATVALAALVPAMASPAVASAEKAYEVVMTTSAKAREQPYKDSNALGTRSKGSTIGVACFVNNKHGNTWYREARNGGLAYARGYIFSGNARKVQDRVQIPQC